MTAFEMIKLALENADETVKSVIALYATGDELGLVVSVDKGEDGIHEPAVFISGFNNPETDNRIYEFNLVTKTWRY